MVFWTSWGYCNGISNAHTIHVWYIYHYLPTCTIKINHSCREIYHTTWIRELGCFDQQFFSNRGPLNASRSCSWKTVVSRDFAWKKPKVETVRSSWRAPWSWPREAEPTDLWTSKWIQWIFLQKTWGRWLGQQGDFGCCFLFKYHGSSYLGGERWWFWSEVYVWKVESYKFNELWGTFLVWWMDMFFLFRRLQGLLFSYSGTCGYLLSLNNMSQAIWMVLFPFLSGSLKHVGSGVYLWVIIIEFKSGIYPHF